MAYDPENHVIDEKTGVLVHKDGRPVGFLSPEHKSALHTEYPKYVEPHASHVVRAIGRAPVAPLWAEHHVDRAGKLFVLVQDEDEEHRALAVVKDGE